MRILTVRQPWAWAIIHGGKDVENRVRNLAGDYRGPIAIHAGLVFDEPDGNDWELRRAITAQVNGWPAGDSEVWASDVIDESDQRFAPRGAIIGLVDLVGVHQSGRHYRDVGVGVKQIDLTERACCPPWGDRAAFHLKLTNPRPLATPIPYKGALGLRHLATNTIDLIQKELP